MAVAKNQPFQLVAGNPALDLVNTLENRFGPSGADDLLRTYDDALRFAAQAGVLSAAETRRLERTPGREAERARTLEQVKDLRETLAAVAYGLTEGKTASTAQLALLEKYFGQASAHRLLVAESGRLAWGWPRHVDVHVPLWLLAQEAADLLVSERALFVRSCANETCRWLFLDTSKNHTRRWCDMKLCGNRMKARRFQARLGKE